MIIWVIYQIIIITITIIFDAVRCWKSMGQKSLNLQHFILVRKMMMIIMNILHYRLIIILHFHPSKKKRKKKKILYVNFSTFPKVWKFSLNAAIINLISFYFPKLIIITIIITIIIIFIFIFTEILTIINHSVVNQSCPWFSYFLL